MHQFQVQSLSREHGVGSASHGAWGLLGLKRNILVSYAALLLCLETLTHRNR
jgi:hypothetical protein